MNCAVQWTATVCFGAIDKGCGHEEPLPGRRDRDRPTGFDGFGTVYVSGPAGSSGQSCCGEAAHRNCAFIEERQDGRPAGGWKGEGRIGLQGSGSVSLHEKG